MKDSPVPPHRSEGETIATAAGGRAAGAGNREATDEQRPPPSPRTDRAVRRIQHDIERTLHARRATKGTKAAKVEDTVKTHGARVWRQLRKRPSLGIVAAGGVGIVAAELVGIGELAMGLALGYAAYLVLRKGVPIGEAIRETEELMRGPR